MSYPHMKRGDILPTVGGLQLLLNRQGEKLGVDGIFGPKTQGAVERFQAARTLPGKEAAATSIRIVSFAYPRFKTQKASATAMPGRPHKNRFPIQ